MSQIQNGIGIARVTFEQDTQVEGQPHGRGRDMPYENPLLAQVATTTWSADTDVSDEIVAGQVIRTVLTDPDGVAYTVDYTVTAQDDTDGTDAAGLALMAQRQAERINGEEALNNIVEASYSGAVCTVTWLHPDPRGDWGYTSTVIPAAVETTLVTTEDPTAQAQGGSSIPMGRFLAYGTPAPGGRRRGVLPSSATAVLACVSHRDPTQPRGSSQLSSATNDYQAGTVMTGREQGQISVRNVSDVAAVAGRDAYAVISTAGGDALGQARADRDGVADVWTLTPTVANDTLYGISLHFPAWDGEPAVTLSPEPYLSDGTATDVEICDGIRAGLAALGPSFTDLATAGGTTTVVLTGAVLGRPFVVTDAAEAGDWTSITNTTPAVAYTKKAQARWDEAVAPRAVGKVYTNF